MIWGSDSDLILVLANPQHIKNAPGRKIDMKDTEWIAQLGRCGLIEPSYIPSPEVVQLRSLTRRMRSYKQRQTQVKNEIHNLLQRANIRKLTSYLSDIFSKTGQALLKLLINGETKKIQLQYSTGSDFLRFFTVFFQIKTALNKPT